MFIARILDVNGYEFPSVSFGGEFIRKKTY